MNQSTRSKFINKYSQTLPAAARWLSNSFGEKVTEADILQLALDDRLTLSVKFETKNMAICSRVVNYKNADLDLNIARGIFPDELKRNDLPDEIIESIKKSFVDIMIEDFKFWELSECHAFGLYKQRHIIVKSMLDMAFNNLRTNTEDQFLVEENYELLKAGVFDLSMLGTEIVEVKRRIYKLTGALNVDVLKKGCTAGTGVCLKGSDGKILKLQMGFDSIKYQDKSLVQLNELELQIKELFEDYYKEEYLLVIYRKVAQKRMQIWQKLVSIDGFQNKNYCPLDYLPEDSHLVVRNEVLLEFERLNLENDNKVEKNTAAQLNLLPVKRAGGYNKCIVDVMTDFINANGYAPATVDEVINRMKHEPPLGLMIEFLGKEVRMDSSEKKKPLKNLIRAIKRQLVLQK